MKKIILTISLITVLAVAGIFYITQREQSTNGRDDSGRLNVVSSFSVINSIVEEIGGKYVNAHSITAIGADQHDYQPTPTDIKRTNDAAIVFANGLNLEKGGSGWFEKLLKSTNKKSVDVTNGIKTIKLTTKSVSGQDNPHAWNGALEGKKYTENIANELIKKDPKHKEYYLKKSQEYQNKLQNLFEKWNEKFSALPEEKKYLVTQESAMSYFARDFNLKTYFIWEIDTESNGTPKQIKKLVDELKDKNDLALFVEQGESKKPMETVASETKFKIKGTLWTDSISNKNGTVPNYFDLLIYNAETVYNGIANS